MTGFRRARAALRHVFPILVLPTSAAAQPTPVTEVIVTAATPLRADAQQANLIATGDDLFRTNAIDLTDFLRRRGGGVFVNDIQNNPLQPDINYRGFTASPLLGTPQGLSVYVDGVRVNQPFGEVVSWDIIPRSAIQTVALVPGSNPVFGRNTLGGALAMATRSGRTDPGVHAEASGASYDRWIGSARAGGVAGAIDWFASGDVFRENGWRDFSRSKAVQTFGKLGYADGDTSAALSLSFADTDLNGNGLQEMRLLDRDRGSVYTHPDNTRNSAWLANLRGQHQPGDGLELSANLFWRRIATRTFNGDINDDSLGESLYQPNAAERAALAAAGVTGGPTSGETQANTPFPRFRCIANVLLNDEPNEKCNGLANRSRTGQHELGGAAEMRWTDGPLGAVTVGVAVTRSRAKFVQSSQFGYLTPTRGIVPVDGPGAFADGSQDSENAFDARVDLSARTTGISGFVLDTLDLAETLRLDLSARFDHTAIRNRDRITPGGGSGSLDTDARYHRLNPAAKLIWAAGTGLSLDATLSQASRAPSAIELGCADPANPCRLPNALAGDPPLNQVVAQSGELGATFTRGRLRVRLVGFRTVSRDDILFVADDASGFGYFRNFGRTRREGLDVDASATLGRLRLVAAYSFLDATFRSEEEVDGSANSSAEHAGPGFEGEIEIERGDRIPLIPRHNLKLSADWMARDWLSLSADMTAVSGAVARGNENGEHEPDGVYYLGPGRSRGYAVFNLGVEVRPVPVAAVFAQVSNLFNRRYATAAQLAQAGFTASGDFVSRPFAGPMIEGEYPLVSSTFYGVGATRMIRIGARLTF